MSSPGIQSGEVSNQVDQSAGGSASDHCLESYGQEKEVRDEEEEDEDVDFNPLMKESHSPEASSSLSSEVDGLDGDIVLGKSNSHAVAEVDSLNCTAEVPDSGVCDTEREEEETVMQSTGSPELQNISLRQYGPFSRLGRDREIASNCKPEANDVVKGTLSNAAHAWMRLDNDDDDGGGGDDDDDDAICKRTRARYSLAGFTLDELEAFLQETDDDNDVHNVDDEEEYRKFLSAVLLSGDSDNQPNQGNGNVDDDDDEDNDADFEIELEEALESDDDGNMGINHPEEHRRAARRPETRQNRRQKASVQFENRVHGRTKRPLRPLRPIPSAPIVPNPAFNQIPWKPHDVQSHPSDTLEEDLVNGFKPHQIGQLHCLIHEHVQLLIQIYSLCVLDPSRQHIASQVHGLILEILHRRDEVATRRSEPLPGICFCPEYVCSSVVKEYLISSPDHCSSESSTFASQEAISSNKALFYENIPLPEGTCENASGQQRSWVPLVRGSILTVLDVAPLNLVEKYMDDIHVAVREYRQRQLEKCVEVHSEKDPLFPCPFISSATDSDSEAVKASCLPDGNLTLSATQQPSKKTLAAAIVERAMKQSVAPVPKEIAQLALIFFPLFNPALFPHKPPLAAVANRVLFTDSEDELLALGLMLCNSDWKAIQERFLPCKSEHQIFVRQKNRCSSKAPENSIKAVRRMKNSPLSLEEIKKIHEGLTVFKLDWMSIWRFIVPYRDPSLLPRQWRIAHGTQKSYKQNAEKKERRRQYESQRRQKAAEMVKWQDPSDKEDYQPAYLGGGACGGGGNMDPEDESYVHEAFLADWRPGTSMFGASEKPFLDHRGQTFFNTALLHKSLIREAAFHGSVLVKSTTAMHGFQYAGNSSQQADTCSNASNMQVNNSNPNMRQGTLKSHIYAHQPVVPQSNPRIVKLAPGLPPVNLPPSVRVISNSTLKISQFRGCAMASTPGGSMVDTTIVNLDVRHQHLDGVERTDEIDAHIDKSNLVKEKVKDPCAAPGTCKDKSIVESTCSDSELQMHPLLFEPPNDGQLSYFPLHSGSSSSSSFSFFSGNQPRLNLSLFHNPHQASSSVDHLSIKAHEATSVSSGIDFHPLLQHSNETRLERVTTCTSVPVTTCSERNCATGTSFSIRNETSGLDLEIHLSSSMDGFLYSRKATVNLASSENANGTSSCPDMPGSELVSGAKLVASEKSGHESNIETIIDQSHPGIVMEQEELSDSDEDVEEHVEFEREEMADSEGDEGSGCEQINEATADVNSVHRESELSRSNGSDGNVCSSTRSSPPSSKSGPTCQLRKDIDNSSWLSLDSSVDGHSSYSKSRSEGKSLDNAPRKLSGSLSQRLSKQRTAGTKGAMTRKLADETREKLELDPTNAPKCRKPRKRARHANADLNFRGIGSSNLEDES